MIRTEVFSGDLHLSDKGKDVAGDARIGPVRRNTRSSVVLAEYYTICPTCIAVILLVK